MNGQARDIHPRTEISTLTRQFSSEQLERSFDDHLVSALVGMHPTFVQRVLKSPRGPISLAQVLVLLDQDAYAETFVPRSRIPAYLLSCGGKADSEPLELERRHELIRGSALAFIPRLPAGAIQCVVTSTPYWGTRLYEEHHEETWADGERCALGHEQTPEAFIRHTVEILFLLKRVMASRGSVWWNLGDSYNTRTQIRQNAAETLRAMRGEDPRSWKDYDCRRYSAGHSYLKDGEQCLIPARVAVRASRIGYWVKSVITWKKKGSMPETVTTRVTREAEYVIHLALHRTPYIDKSAFHTLPSQLGGRNREFESGKLTDVWYLPTALGTEGHGAQFPLSLPGRCIALSTAEDDLVLDPFIGAGTTSVAAARLGRRSVGFEVGETYLATASEKLAAELDRPQGTQAHLGL